MPIKSDIKILKELNKKLNSFGVQLKLQYYNISPLSIAMKNIVPIIIEYADKMTSYRSKIFLLSVLGVQGFDEAIPYLVQQYRIFNLKIYSEPFDDILCLYLCNTIEKIKSNKYIDLYAEMLQLPSMSALECIIRMCSELNLDGVENYIFNLIEKENKIPKTWIGQLNEEDKYWCSQNALIYIINKKRPEYYSYIEKFFHP